MKLTDSSLIANMIQECKGLSWTVNFGDVVEVIQFSITGTVDFLKQVKSKKEKTALVFEDIKGNMVAAATVEYIEGEDGNPGNWSVEFTFDPEDIKDCKTYSIYESGPKEVIAKRGFDDFKVRFSAPDVLSQLSTLFFSLLKDFLDQNAVEGSTFELKHDPYFVATVGVIDGEKVMSFIPDGAVKRLIKDDDSSSENATE